MSTNQQLMDDSTAGEGDWLVALDQTAGKGRQGRAWVGQIGNFHGSTLVRLRDGDPPAQSLSMVAGLALAEAVDAAVPDQPLMLKWPNDLLSGGAKLAGILLERQGDRVVVGFGVNLASAPDVGERRTAHLGGQVTPADFAPVLADAMSRLLSLWRSAPVQMFAQAWLARAHPIGAPLAVHGDDGQRRSGTFDGLEPDGALRLRLPDGKLRIVHAGDVTLG